jgi:choline-sulfatase
MLPHNPLVCPKELFEKYYAKVTMPEVKKKEKNIHPALIKWLKLRGLEKELSKEQILRARAAYYGLIEYMDARVGEVRKALAESGALKDTVFIYTSDHGDMNGEHEMWWKSTLYDGSAGVPLIISCPGKFAKGRVVKQNTNLMDIGPTLIEVANGRQLPRSRGNSLLPFLKKSSIKVSKWKNETYCENTTKYCMEEGATESPSRMIRSGKWKLNYYMGYKNPQLFDMEQDPNETNDLANMPKYKNLRKRLLKKVLKDWDGEFIMREQAKLLEDILPILDQWGKIVKPKGRQWKAPENANKMLDI